MYIYQLVSQISVECTMSLCNFLSNGLVVFINVVAELQWVCLSFAMFFPYLHFLKVLCHSNQHGSNIKKHLESTWKNSHVLIYHGPENKSPPNLGVASRLAIYFHYGVITVHIRLKTTSYCCLLNRRLTSPQSVGWFSPRETCGDLGLKRGQTAVGAVWVFQRWPWWFCWGFRGLPLP